MRPKAESTIALLLNLFFCIPNPEPSSEIMTDNEEEAMKHACLGCDTIINSQSLNSSVCWARMLVRNFKFLARHIKHSQCE